MDAIHDPDSRRWISNKIAAGSYFDEYIKLVNDFKPRNDMANLSDEKMKKMIGLEDQNTEDTAADQEANEAKRKKYLDLLEVMDVKNLDTVGDLPPMQVNNPAGETYGPDVARFCTRAIPQEAASKLKSCFLQQRWLEKTKDKRCYKQRRMRQSRDDNNFMFCAEKPPEKNVNPQFCLKQVLFCVRVYRPFKHLQARQSGRTANVTIK